MERYFLMPLKKIPYPSKIFNRGIWRDIMHLVLNAIFLVMGLKWGDWKNWRKYHATILFLWFGDLLYNVLCYQYIMWQYKESIFAETFLTNHVIISLNHYVYQLSCYSIHLLGEISKTKSESGFMDFTLGGSVFIDRIY